MADELRLAGFGEEAAAVDQIRKKEDWSGYATELIKRAIQVAESKGVLDILKILLYPKPLQPEHVAELKEFKRGSPIGRAAKPSTLRRSRSGTG